MISKELKSLNRRELVDVIYQLKKNEQELKDKVAALEEALQDKRFRISNAGSIADAAVDVSNLLTATQTTADLYLHEITCMKADAERECAQIIESAQDKADHIMEDCEKRYNALRARYQADYKKWQQLQEDINRLEAQKKET